MDLARDKGASSWLTAMPIEEHGFCLHKTAFVDSLALRYGWSFSKTPTTCIYGASFAVDHMLSCPRGGFPSIRHNEIRHLTATLLTEVCSSVTIEPDLQAKNFQIEQQTSLKVQDLTSLPMVSGEGDLKKHFWM